MGGTGGGGGGRGPWPARLAWLGASALVAGAGGRFGRRGALRGLLAAAVAGGGARVLTRRPAPPVVARTAFALGAAVERPQLAVPAGAALVAAGVVGGDRRPTRGELVAATLAGAGAVALTTRVMPRVPDAPPVMAPAHLAPREEPSPDGRGLVVVVNPSAGPALSANPADELRAALPAAEVVELNADDDVDAVIADAVGRARVLGVAGGDGTVNAAAAAALAAGTPLLAVPGGTLNHFCHALGVHTVADAVAAVQAGACAYVTVGEIDGRAFLNTASFGAYTDLVDERERLEHRIGKWPAMAVAMVRVLRRGAPVRVELDGVARDVWMVFLGNNPYEPAGFAPSFRPQMDTGLIDVRLVDARHPWSRTRLVGSLLLGRLARTDVYEQWVAEQLEVRSLGGPMRLARDGETFDGPASFTVETCAEHLRVLVPDA